MSYTAFGILKDMREHDAKMARIYQQYDGVVADLWERQTYSKMLVDAWNMAKIEMGAKYGVAYFDGKTDLMVNVYAL